MISRKYLSTNRNIKQNYLRLSPITPLYMNCIAIKSMKGKWKLTGDKISIIYNDIDYIVYSEYFYIGKDLVLGKNFNHVVFTRENVDFLDVAAK